LTLAHRETKIRAALVGLVSLATKRVPSNLSSGNQRSFSQPINAQVTPKAKQDLLRRSKNIYLPFIQGFSTLFLGVPLIFVLS